MPGEEYQPPVQSLGRNASLQTPEAAGVSTEKRFKPLPKGPSLVKTMLPATILLE